MSSSLWSHGLQHARIPCPSPSPGVCSNSCPSSWWCHPTISSSVVPFSSCLQSLPASGSFPMSWLFASGGHGIRASASASVLPMNIQGWFPLGWTGLSSLLPKGLSKESSPAPQFESINSLVLVIMSLCSDPLPLGALTVIYWLYVLKWNLLAIYLLWFLWNTEDLHYHGALLLSLGCIHWCFLKALFQVLKNGSLPQRQMETLLIISQRSETEVSAGGEKSAANKMKNLSFLFPQISFSAAPALKDCSHGPFSAVILNWVTSQPFLQHFPLKFQWFFIDVCRVVSSFFHSVCDPLKTFQTPSFIVISNWKIISQTVNSGKLAEFRSGF